MGECGSHWTNVSDSLRRLLQDAGRPDFDTGGPIAVDLMPSYLIPDLIVITAEASARNANPIAAANIRLCVEIVSPSSRRNDRFVKPLVYAESGIPNYWRIETDPVITLHAYELDGDSYTETGSWGPATSPN